VQSVAILPDGRRAVTGSWDGSLWLWELETGKELRRFQGHTGIVMSAAITPDGRRVLTASYDNTLRLWDIEAGAELYRFEGHTAKVHTAALSPDGRYALSGSDDGTMRLWELPTAGGTGSASGTPAARDAPASGTPVPPLPPTKVRLVTRDRALGKM